MKDNYWITREGRKILYSDMEDLHLINCVRMLKNNAKKIATELYKLNRHKQYLSKKDIVRVERLLKLNKICNLEDCENKIIDLIYMNFISDSYYELMEEINKRKVDIF